MMISQRIAQMNAGGSDGWDVFYRARAMVQSGEPVTELTIGEHDIRTHPRILAAMDEAARGGHTGYASVPGTDGLRHAVAERIARRTGVATTADNILITPGGQSALFSAHMAVCNPGDRALFIDPYYATYPGTIRAIGAEPVPIQARAEDDFQPRPEDIAKHATGAASLLINSPNNPTGAVYSETTLRGIAEVCWKADLWLISDEVYDTQVWSGAHLSPRALPGMADRTLVVGSMSKSHAMTGSRVGWICGPEQMIASLIDLATTSTYGVPGYIQDAAEFALASDLEREVAAPFVRRRDIAERLVASQNVVGMVPADGAMYVMLDIRATGLTGEEFANALLDSHAIAVMPGESFGQAAAGHVRVAMTVDDAAFEAALSDLLGFAAIRAAA